MAEYFYEDSFGSINITLHGNIVVAEFIGAVSEGIANYLLETGRKLTSNMNAPCWGYISNSLKAEASTPEAQKILLQAAGEYREAGCVRAVFLLTSAIAIAQMVALRKAVGITEPFSDVLFDNFDDAHAYLSDFLTNYHTH